MYEKIPLELKQLPHWVGWKYMQHPGEDHKRKVPINAMDGQPAKSNDPTTWCDFDTACRGKERFGLDGIGFMFSGDGIFGIDIDHCYDPETQELDPAAAEIIETVQSYTELYRAVTQRYGYSYPLQGCSAGGTQAPRRG